MNQLLPVELRAMLDLYCAFNNRYPFLEELKECIYPLRIACYERQPKKEWRIFGPYKGEKYWAWGYYSKHYREGIGSEATNS